jgi:FkbM family methyltransferase
MTHATDPPAFAGHDASLVFDIGMHRGEDTAFYLSRGFRVVGAEANTALVRGLEDRFRAEIRAGRVVVLPVAIGPRAGRMRFAVASGATVFSTGDPGFRELAQRHGVEFESVDVEMTTIGDVIAEYGTPYFMKVDIEGMDRAVVASMVDLPTRPPLLSIESAITGPDAGAGTALAEVRMLQRLGYRRFKLVDQRRLVRLAGTELQTEGTPVTYWPEEGGTSGPFGDEAPGHWRPAGAVVPGMMLRAARHTAVSRRGRWAATRWGARITEPARRAVKRVAPAVHANRWYDLHARA